MIELREHFEMTTRDNPDGSMDISIAYDDIFKRAIREIYGRKRCTKKLIGRFFEGALSSVEEMYPEWDEEENT